MSILGIFVITFIHLEILFSVSFCKHNIYILFLILFLIYRIKTNVWELYYTVQLCQHESSLQAGEMEKTGHGPSVQKWSKVEGRVVCLGQQPCVGLSGGLLTVTHTVAEGVAMRREAGHLGIPFLYCLGDFCRR